MNAVAFFYIKTDNGPVIVNIGVTQNSVQVSTT